MHLAEGQTAHSAQTRSAGTMQHCLGIETTVQAYSLDFLTEIAEIAGYRLLRCSASPSLIALLVGVVLGEKRSANWQAPQAFYSIESRAKTESSAKKFTSICGGCCCSGIPVSATSRSPKKDSLDVWFTS
jgi:hypothetical protein